MTRRVPVAATLLVAIAVAAMIALGIWQLRQLHRKEALIARYSAAATLPAITFPDRYPVSDAVLFRRAVAQCPAVTGWAVEAGRSRAGTPGWRHIALCATIPGRPAVRADVGVSDRPTVPDWHGGAINGLIAWAPQHDSMIARMWGRAVPREPMIVADVPAPGLAASTPPSVADIPNNHLSYAVQWFLFAATATVIYLIALRRRMIAERSGDS